METIFAYWVAAMFCLWLLGIFVKALLWSFGFPVSWSDGDDYEMTEEEEAAYHYEFFHRR